MILRGSLITKLNLSLKIFFSLDPIIKILGIFIFSKGNFSQDVESTIKTWYSEFIEFGPFSELISPKSKLKKGFNSSSELLKFLLHEMAALILKKFLCILF